MKKLILVFFTFLICRNSMAQCTVASFSAPDTFCIASPLTLQNTSTGTGLSYYWDFCASDYENQTPGSAFQVVGPNLRDFDMIKVQNQYYLLTVDTFVSLFGTVSYGNNLSATTSTYVTYPSFQKMNCLDFVNQGDSSLIGLGAYAADNSFHLITFPNGINAQPVSTPLPSMPSFDSPMSLKIVENNGNFFAFVTNKNNNVLTCVSFGNSLLNTPSQLYSYNVTQANGLRDFDVDMSCNAITGFCLSVNNGNIIKLDFGSGISIAPTSATDIGTFGSTSNLSLHISREGTNSYLFFTDISTNLLKALTYANHSYSATPTLRTISSNFFQPGIINSLTDSSFNKLMVSDNLAFNPYEQRFLNSCNGISYSGDVSPVISFSNPGWNKITLVVHDGGGYETSFTDSIFISSGPTASFSVSANTCFNLNDSISFTDLSTSPSGSISAWNWNFGDGNSSTSQNPYHTFDTTGTFNVQLTITAGCAKDTVIPVTIRETPEADFNASTACAGTNTPFTDLSTTGSSSLQGWAWDFGDSSTDTLQNPSHSYAVGGTYNVTLTVRNSQGCADSYVLPLVIKSTPHVAFNISNTCVGDTVQFINQTVISDSTNITYNWDLGNAGATSTLESPQYSYPGAGSYTVTLIAYSTQSCSDTLVQQVSISNPPVASFSFPASNCQNTNVPFTDNSTGSGISSWLWDFGDGDTSTLQNPQHAFSGSGNFNVTLTVSAGNNCTASISNTISIIAGPVAQFTAPPVCNGSTTVFTDQSTAPTGSTITSWYYSYGDTNGSSLQNPQYTYGAPGTYNATLEVISSDGCVDSVTQAVVIYEIPVANFIIQTLRCAGSEIFFIDQSTLTNGAITNWQWSFSDGDSSSLQDPYHTFQNPGNAAATLTVTSFAGCTNSAFSPFTVLPAPQFNFSYSATCLGDSSQFSYTPISGGSSNFAWTWSFGDGSFGFVPNPRHKYNAAGNYQVLLTVTDSSGCFTTNGDTITVNGKPNAAFITNGICQNAPVTFVNQTSALGAVITAWNWNFGDTQFSSDSAAQHVYTSAGNFTAQLIVEAQGGCNDTAKTTVNIKPVPNANFTISQITGAPNTPVNFTNSSNGATQYLWQFGDGLPTAITQDASYTYADTGSYAVSLVATSLYGCKDTAVKFFDVIDPYIDLIMQSLSYTISSDHYLQVSATIANAGNINATSYDLEVIIEGMTKMIETGNTIIPLQDEKTYPLNARFKVADKNLPAYACVKILNVNKGADGKTDNNEKCININDNLNIAAVSPNPVNDFLNVSYSLPDDGEVNISIVDSRGRTIKELLSSTETAGAIAHTFSVKSLSAGVYYLQVTSKDATKHQKFFKQ